MGSSSLQDSVKKPSQDLVLVEAIEKGEVRL